jgi:hypothetical protein
MLKSNCSRRPEARSATSAGLSGAGMVGRWMPFDRRLASSSVRTMPLACSSLIYEERNILNKLLSNFIYFYFLFFLFIFYLLLICIIQKLCYYSSFCIYLPT